MVKKITEKYRNKNESHKDTYMDYDIRRKAVVNKVKQRHYNDSQRATI